MRTIYHINQYGVFTGRIDEISDREGRQSNWIASDTAPPDGTAQWTGDGWRVLEERPQPSIESVRDEAMARIKSAHANAMRAITDRFPQTEREGWGVLIAQAKAGTGDALEAYAAGLGVSTTDAATRLVTAAQQTEQLYGNATGTLTTLRDQVDAAHAAGDVAALQSIDWPQ